MTLISLFTASTGVFCFIPISQRLAESGIIPSSSSWRFRTLPSPAYSELITDKGGDPMPAKITISLTGRTLDADQTLVTNEWFTVSPLEHSHSFLPPTPVDVIGRHEYDRTLCNSCNTLLRGEIPPDHIPSVVRALALFEARERLSNIVFNEYEITALTNAFSMLRL